MWYRRRPYWRRRGIFGFPFMLFFIAFFVFHSWFGFVLGIAMIIVFSLLLRAIMAGTFGGGGMNTAWRQPPYQQPQQPYEQYYQPSYQPYEEGYQYQPPAPTYQEPQYKAPQPQYDEQPQAEYPQELPPMEQ